MKYDNDGPKTLKVNKNGHGIEQVDFHLLLTFSGIH